MRLATDEHMQHKDVFEHSLVVMEQAIERRMTARLVLRLAALLHDIGKPQTRRLERDGRAASTTTRWSGRMTRAGYARCATPSCDRRRSRWCTCICRFHGYGTGEWTDSAVRPLRTEPGRLLPAAQLGPVRLHHPQPAPAAALQRKLRLVGGADRGAARAGGAGRDPARPGRQRDHEGCWTSSPDRWSAKAYKHLLAAAWSKARHHDEAVGRTPPLAATQTP